MAGENLSHPPKSKGYFGSITPLEWFRMTWKGSPYTGMVVRTDVSSIVLMIDKDGSLTQQPYAGIAADAEFLGYLTTEESVTIYGSLDPNWVEPEPELVVGPAPPSDPRNLFEIPVGVPFRYSWDEYSGPPSIHIGIKLPSLGSTQPFLVLRVNTNPDGHDRSGTFGDDVNTRCPSDERKFIQYEPEIPERLRNHPYRDRADWTGVV